MKVWQAIVLGLVQGLTEFLPVSSSGHLALFMRCFGVDEILFFSIMLHLGTLVAVCVIFWKDIIALFKKPFKTLGFLALATIPAALVGFLADDYIEDAIINGPYFGILLAVFFIITAAVLFVTELVAKSRFSKLNGESDMVCVSAQNLPICFKTAIPMGLAQAVAVLPGISRSGSTICAGTLAGGKSEDIAKFSFLMSIPMILGSFIVELYKGIKHGSIAASFAEGGAQFGWSIALGFIISAAAGLFAIKVMYGAIKKANYKWFSVYLLLIAITAMVLQFTYF